MDDQMEYKDFKKKTQWKTAECGTTVLMPTLIFFICGSSVIFHFVMT